MFEKPIRLIDKNINRESEKSDQEFVPKYSKPKIILIDLTDKILSEVRSAGFNAVSGTFGSPYKVEKSDSYEPLIMSPYLPNYTEQEIVIIDLTFPKFLDRPEREKFTTDMEKDWWAKCNQGYIDPRPRAMFNFSHSFFRILNHGGFFIIFAQPIITQKIINAKLDYHGHFEDSSPINANNWSFLSFFSSRNFKIITDYGKEIYVNNKIDHSLIPFLHNNIKDSRFAVSFSIGNLLKEKWLSLLINKYGKCVGGLYVPKSKKGRILILPQMSNKEEVVITLLREFIPEISPHLFPFYEGSKWIERYEYEIDSILKLKAEKIEVQERAKDDIQKLDNKITKEREKYRFIHGLITGTGSNLVKHVQNCLEFIGFEKVINVDELIKKTNSEESEQEDLQIKDKSPVILIEIKGLSKLPHESDTLQISKYVLRRMSEWKRTDVHGISIINHQRNIPPLERNNENVFTKQQIKDSELNNITLVSTWDLFLLVRGMMKCRWPQNAIQDLLFKKGKLDRIPTNYVPIGKIVKYYDEPKVIIVEVTNKGLKLGNRIGYVIPDGYLEEDVFSLQIDKEDVEEASVNQKVGVETKYPKEYLRKGMFVYLVK